MTQAATGVFRGTHHINVGGSAMFLDTTERLRQLKWAHLISTVASTGNTGATTWIADFHGHAAAISWNWAIIDRGVMSVDNIFSISSNIYPTDDDLRPIPKSKRTLVLAGIVTALPWQQVVQSYLEDQIAD